MPNPSLAACLFAVEEAGANLSLSTTDYPKRTAKGRSPSWGVLGIERTIPGVPEIELALIQHPVCYYGPSLRVIASQTWGIVSIDPKQNRPTKIFTRSIGRFSGT